MDRGRTCDRLYRMTWHAATTSVLATAIDLEEEAQLAAAQDSSAGESETEPAVWDALPLFTFGSCWLNKVVDKELFLDFPYGGYGHQDGCCTLLAIYSVPVKIIMVLRNILFRRKTNCTM